MKAVIKTEWKNIKIRVSNKNKLPTLIKQLKRARTGWNEKATALASTNGHLKCLKYLHKNGCPWDEDVFDAAVTN